MDETPRRGLGKGRIIQPLSSLRPRTPTRSPERSSLAMSMFFDQTEPIEQIRSSSIATTSTAAIKDAEMPTEVPPVAHKAVQPEVDYIVTRRPGQKTTGQQGKKLSLSANYFHVKSVPGWSLFEYRVDFQPDEERTRNRKYIFRQIIGPMKIGFMFDGTTLFTSTLIQKQAAMGKALIFNINRALVIGDQAPRTMSIRLIKKVDDKDPANFELCNVLVRKCLRALELEPVGRNFFEPKAAIRIPQHKLELWPGYVTSMRRHEKAVLLCVDVTHLVLHLDSVLVTIKNLERAHPNRHLFMNAVKEGLGNSTVMTSYNWRMYRVDHIDFCLTPASTFNLGEELVTYADYYKSRYGITVNDMTQPLIVTRPTQRDLRRGDSIKTILVPELCQSIGLTASMRANFSLMKDLSKHLNQGPEERMKAINLFMGRIMSNEELRKHFSDWGLELVAGHIAVPGRELHKEVIVFAGGKEHAADDKGDFTAAFKTQKMLSTVTLKKWVIIVPSRDVARVDNLLRTLSTAAMNIKMQIASPVQIIRVKDGMIQDYLRALDEAVKLIKDLQLAFVILPNNNRDLYASVKRRLGVDAGIPSQCFLAKNMTSKGLMSIATKVVVQMNAKLGGEPWTIKLPMKNTMFVGFDVYYGIKGRRGSLGAMVATLSPTFSRYFSTTLVFHTADELAKFMREDIKQCLFAYREENNDLPDHVIVYRDGVGEGQLKEVFNVELKQLRQGIKELYSSCDKPIPKLIYIVVTKKINTRLSLTRQGHYDNPGPGTVVDDVITLPERYDFFLVSCGARQGTVSPCSYHVLYDDSAMDIDKIQSITYKMCHMYFNQSGTVAVPAPCQYAHKLAFLTATAYNGHANSKLSKLLHFL